MTTMEEEKLFASVKEGKLSQVLDIAMNYHIDIKIVRNFRKQTLLHIAAGFGSIDLVAFLVNSGADVNAKDIDGSAPLHYACNHQHRSTSLKLIRAGADVNIKDKDGWSPLDISLNCMNKALDQESIDKYWRVIELLVLSGANLDSKSHSGRTTLFRLKFDDDKNYLLTLKMLGKAFAASGRQLRLILIDLLSQEKSIDVINKVHPLKGHTLLHEAIISGRETLKILIEECRHVLNFDVCDTTAKPARVLAKELGLDHLLITVTEFFELLVRDDVNIDIIKKVTTKALLKSTLVVNGKQIFPIHRTAGYNKLEIAKYFLDIDSKIVENRDSTGMIPMHYAASYGHLDMIQLLKDYGCDVNAADYYARMTPLHLAADKSNLDTCLKLKDLGANLTVKNIYDQMPYDLAMTIDKKRVLKPHPLHNVRSKPSSSSTQAIYLEVEGPTPSQIDDVRVRESLYGSNTVEDLMLNILSEQKLISNANEYIKKITLDRCGQIFRMVSIKMTSTIKEHDNELCGKFSNYDITSIDRILNEDLWLNYKAECDRLKRKNKGKINECLLFHGSSNVEDIMINGFEEGFAKQDGMFGAGLYFAKHSSKSNQYTFGFNKGCVEHNDKTCFVCERKLVYSQVALGLSFEGRDPKQYAHAPPGYDSVTALPGSTDVCYPEYVIYRGQQAYPLFIITYRIVR